jgi:hypothetical protein
MAGAQSILSGKCLLLLSYCEEDEQSVNAEVWSGSGIISGITEQMNTMPGEETQQENPENSRGL